MKKYISRITIVIFFTCFFSVTTFGQSDLTTIRDLLRIYYVEKINDPNYTPVLLDNTAIMNGNTSGPFWTNAKMAGPQKLVRALLTTGGDATLQRITAKVLKILNKPVKVNLLDDSSANVGAVARRLYGACEGSRGKAWPCASNMTGSDDWRQDCAKKLGNPLPARRDGVWAGEVCMGTVYLSQGDFSSKISTIVHEIVHTQDYTDGRAHLFWVGKTWYGYGADGDHYGTEAIPNMAQTYQEGIANIMRLLYDQKRLVETFNWFAKNEEMLVEKAIHPPNTGPSDSLHVCTAASVPSPDVWLFNQLEKAGVKPSSTYTVGKNVYAAYKIRSLPARIIAHNEYILAMLGEEYALHVGESKLFNAIRAVNSQGLRTSLSAYAVFYNSLCMQALPAGQTLETIKKSPPASGVPKPYLLPLAYADYFTGYTAQTKEDFKAIFENQFFMNDWVDLYWDHARTLVRTKVPMKNLVLGNLTDIAIAMGVNSTSIDN